MNPRLTYRIGQLVIFPLFAILHGLVWVFHKESYAPAVYGMKLALFPFMLITCIQLLPGLFKERLLHRAAAIMLPCFLISFAAPLLYAQPLSGYYLADAAGLGITIGAVVIIATLLKRGVLTWHWVEQTMAYFLAIASVYCIAYYFYSGGDKISIPLEMHVPMALVIGAYLAPVEGGYRPPVVLIALIAAACAFSQLRENLMIYVLTGSLCIIRGLIVSAPRKPMLFFVIISVFIFLLAPLTSSLTAERAGAIADTSINQRFVEAKLVVQEMARLPISFVVGKGFGATYANTDGVLIYYGERVHNVHSTPFVVYLRNGLYGLVVYFALGALAGLTLFSRNVQLFRASLCVCLLYCALMFNQYLYWSVPYGLAVGLWIFSLQHRKAA